MSWFDDIIDAVSDAAEAVGNAVEDAATAVAEAVSNVVETVGNAVEDALDWLGGDVPILSDILGWFGGMISGVFDFASSVIRGAIGFLGGLVGGIVKIVGGILTFNGDLILEGLGDVASSLVGALVAIVGKFVALVQHIILVQAKERGLTDAEIALLKRVFFKTITYYNVRLIEGRAGLFSLNSRPFTLGNTIYLKGRNVTIDPGLLVHEATHVWQNQNHGARYASDAIYAQWSLNNAYSWVEEIARGVPRWVDFNVEAQAAFLEDVFARGELLSGVFNHGVIATGNGVFYDADGITTRGRFVVGATDYTAIANVAANIVRGGPRNSDGVIRWPPATD